MSSLTVLLLACWMLTQASPAGADAIKFYTGMGGYGGPFNGAGTVYGVTAASATATCGAGSSSCALVGGDIFASPLVFTGTGVSASSTNIVWWDLSPSFAGLGVGSLSEGSEADQIADADVLHIQFAVPVMLTGVGTLFDSGHTPFGETTFQTPGSIAGGNGFYLSLDGTFSAANFVSFNSANNTNGGAFDLMYVGTDFYFKQAPEQPQFYVGALTYQAVPGPIAGAGLPGLLLVSGGFFAWRKRRLAQTA